MDLFDLAGLAVAALLALVLLTRAKRRASREHAEASKLALVAMHTGKMAVIADVNCRIEWVNAGFERMTGYSLAEAVGKTPGELLDGPGKDQAVVTRVREAVRSGSDIEVELVNYTKDQQPYWARLELRALRDSSGALTGFIALQSDITARKSMEAALRTANERFEQIARQSHAVIWEVDLNGRFTYVSPMVTSTLGYTVEELLGFRCESLLARNRQSAKALRELREGTLVQLVDYEIDMRSKSGEQRYCLISAGPMMDADGRPVGFRGEFNDISERRLAEQQLRDSEARFKRAMSGSSDGLWDLDLTNGTIYISTRLKTLLGYEEDGLPDHVNDALENEHQLVHPEDLPELKAVRDRHLRDRSPMDVTMRLRCADGNYRWFRIRAATEHDENGQPRRLAGVLSDVTDLKEAQNLLQWRAYHDPLTGLANRQLLLTRLDDILQNSRRNKNGIFAILAMDFDRFKMVNDLHGHDAGDELLCSIAQRLTESVRDEDLVARFGGDEFVILLESVDSVESVEQAARRLAENCARPHMLKRGVELTTTASTGVLILDPHDNRSSDLILREADAAMYQAKAENCGSFRFFDRELRLLLTHKAELESDLRNANFDRAFELHYQPIVNLESGDIEAFEALLRWRRNGHELVSPAEFIPIAEDTGLIIPIGRWVINRACRDLARWRRQSCRAKAIRITVNVSRREFGAPALPEQLLQAVHDHHLVPRDVTLEITETALVDNSADLLPIARKLKSQGFLLAMDDFGTGQSSLNSLVDLPIDILKIDRRFISNMSASSSCIAIVNAVISLAHHMSLTVVAEGIETVVEVATLQAMECPYGQGHLFARPMTAEAAHALISKQDSIGGRPSAVQAYPAVTQAVLDA